MRIIAKDKPAVDIAAVLTSPFERARDLYTIVVNAKTTIVPCATGASLVDDEIEHTHACS